MQYCLTDHLLLSTVKVLSASFSVPDSSVIIGVVCGVGGSLAVGAVAGIIALLVYFRCPPAFCKRKKQGEKNSPLVHVGIKTKKFPTKCRDHYAKKHSNKVWAWQYAIKAAMMAYKTRN